MKKETYMIYSYSNLGMVPYGFTFEGEHYIYNDADMVYYNEDTDEEYFMEIPTSAELDTERR